MKIKNKDFSQWMTYSNFFLDFYDPVVFDLESIYHGWATHYNALFYAVVHRNTKRFYKSLNFFQNNLFNTNTLNIRSLELLKLEPEKLKYRKADPQELYLTTLPEELKKEFKKFDKRASILFDIFTQEIFSTSSKEGFQRQMAPEKVLPFLENTFSDPEYLEVYQWNIDWIPSDFKVNGYEEKFDLINEHHFSIWTVYDQKSTELTVLFGDFYFEYW